MKNNKATAAQRGFIASLASKVGDEAFDAAFVKAAAWNGNGERRIGETPTQAAGRLTKTSASKLIDELLKLAA